MVVFLCLIITIFMWNPALAYKAELYNYSDSVWIIAVGNGLTGDSVVQCDTCRGIEPRNPAKNRFAWIWNSGSPDTAPTGSIIRPEPAEAMDRTITHATNLTGSKQQAYEELTKRPALLIAILSDRYGDAGLIYDRLVSDGTLSESQAEKFKDILDGSFIP